jgi:hypothetical protein
MQSNPYKDAFYDETRLSGRGIWIALVLAIISAALAGGVIWSYEQRQIDDLKSQIDVQAQDLEKAQYQIKHNNAAKPTTATSNQTAR